MKYNKKIILDYINGNDIKGYDIDELEKDKEFILEAIEISGDKNMYNLLNEEDKKDYRIVKRLIETFKNDRKFTLQVASNYIDGQDSSLENEEYFEILIMMESNRRLIDENLGEETYIKLKLDSFYSVLSKVVELRMAVEGDSRFSKGYLGTGFLYMEIIYEHNKIIRDYLAKKRTEEIFGNLEKIEEELHKRFKTLDEINKKGLNNYIIDYIYVADEALSKHISCNTNLLDDLKEKMMIVLDRWEEYTNENNYNICEYISDECDATMPVSLSKRQVFTYLAKKLNNSAISDYIKTIEKEMDELNEGIAVNVYVKKLEDADEEIKKRHIPDDIMPIIIVEEDIVFEELSFRAKEWLIKLEEEVKDMFKTGYKDDYERAEIKLRKEKEKSGKIYTFPKKEIN